MPESEQRDLKIDGLIAEIGAHAMSVNNAEAREAARAQLLGEIAAEQLQSKKQPRKGRRRLAAFLLPLVLLPVAIAGASQLDLSGVFVSPGEPASYSLEPLDPALLKKIREEHSNGVGGAPIADEVKEACRASLENPRRAVRTDDVYIESHELGDLTYCHAIARALGENP